MAVNLYDPKTLQGSVWNEEDVKTKLAEGFITEEEFVKRMEEKAKQERQVWLTSEDTLEERFRSLRMVRDSKISATDYLMTSDYPITEARKALISEYRTKLRDITTQPGAPWDGGGELTPWPQMP